MLASVRALPEQCRAAWELAQGLKLPSIYRNIDRIVVLGMGGSAIAGDLWRVLLQRECAVPVFNVRSYDLPPYVDERTLVIASSFSGDTEEVLSAFEQALLDALPEDRDHNRRSVARRRRAQTASRSSRSNTRASRGPPSAGG